MNVKKLTCVECPMGCPVEVQLNEQGEVVSVTGYTCVRGKRYAENEVVCPKRVLTTTVRAKDGRVVPVKTDAPVKKSEMQALMAKINAFACDTPVRIGDVLIANFTEEANLVATDNLE